MTHFLTLAATLMGTSFCSFAEDERQPTVNADDLRRQIQRSQSNIESFVVVYRDGLARDGTEIKNDYYGFRKVAANSAGDCLLVATHGYINIPWFDDPFQQQGYLFGKRFKNVNPINRTVIEADWAPESPLPGSSPNEFFMTATGIWPFKLRPEPAHLGEGRPFMLKNVARSMAYSVRPILERSDGRWCHVLERPGIDRLWLDAARNATLMCREYCNENGDVMQRFEHIGHTEVINNVWLPRWIRSIQYDHRNSDPKGRRRVVLDALITVLDLKLNCTTDDLFSYNYSSGDSILTREGEILNELPGGIDHLENLSRWLQRRSENSLPAISIGKSVFWLFAAFVAMLTCCYLFRCWRRSS